MPKAIVAMLLSVTSSVAAAEWVEISGADNATIYVDPTTIRRTGNMVKVWTLVNYKTPKKAFADKKFMSQREQHEFDCQEEQWRTLYMTLFSKSMADGDIVHTDDDPDKWAPIPPNTPAEAMWKFACGMK